MDSKKLLFILALVLGLFLSFNLVIALEDFSASAKSSIDICPCSNQAYPVTVENIGTSIISFRVVTGSGSSASWVTFTPSKFTLSPGQSGNFLVFVNSPCNAIGDYELEFFITTSNGLTKALKQTLSFSDCYGYTLESGNAVEKSDRVSFLSHEGPYILCKNEQDSIPILIVNNDQYENRYFLELDGPEFTNLNANEVALDGEKSGIVLIESDNSDIEGEFILKLNALSLLGEIQKKLSLDIEVEDCSDLGLDIEEESGIICSGEETIYNLTLKNPVDFKQTLELKLKAPDWVELDYEKEFDLRSRENKVIEILILPDEDVSGSYNVEVSAIVDNKTELMTSDSIEINVFSRKECYKADINTKSSVTNTYNKDFFFAEVTNTGKKKAEFDVSLDGEDWVSISPDFLELNPGMSGNLNIILDPAEDVVPGTYDLVIYVKSEDDEFSQKVQISLREENAFVKGVKQAFKMYKYYLYIALIILVIFFIFQKQILRASVKAKKKYERYLVKRERKKVQLEIRREREEEKKKEKEKEQREKESEIKAEKISEKKIEKTTKRKTKKPISTSRKSKSTNKKWLYPIIIIFLLAILVFAGDYAGLFDAQYLHIYIWNFFVGYLYYILIGIGAIAALLLVMSFYNYIHNQEKNNGNSNKRNINIRQEKRQKKPKKSYKRAWLKFIITIFIAILLILFIFSMELDIIIKDFLILYQYYIVSGAVILIAVILLFRFYKPLFKFLKE